MTARRPARAIAQKVIVKKHSRIQLRSATFVRNFRRQAAAVSEPLKQPRKRSTDEALQAAHRRATPPECARAAQSARSRCHPTGEVVRGEKSQHSSNVTSDWKRSTAEIGFKLNIEGKNRDRLVDATKHEIRQYLKRERNKALPDGADFRAFDCCFGLTEALVVRLIKTLTK